MYREKLAYSDGQLFKASILQKKARNYYQNCKRNYKKYIFIVIVTFSLGYIETVEKDPEQSSFSSKEAGYIIPYIKGQGINNQLWDYRTAAIVAKATDRVLCLEPFHRFYLQKKGRQFIPFEELFDTNTLKRYVEVEVGGMNCAEECGKTIDHHFDLVSKELKKNAFKAFPIADWRPGSLKNFKLSTGFQKVPLPIQLNVSKLQNLEAIHSVFNSYKYAKCISIAASSHIDINKESLSWSRFLEVNQNIKHAVKEIHTSIFSSQKYLALHWRFEETKCSGLGKGIGFGRALDKTSRPSNHIIMKSDKSADLCFYAGPLPKNYSKKGVWLRMISKEAIVSWIRNIMREKQLESVYLATDCSDEHLLSWIKQRTGAVSKIDLFPILTKHISLEDNEIVSRMEQQLCSEAEVFAGTIMSSWTSSVIEERLKLYDKFFVQEKYNITKRPDPLNKTFYMDIESCNCDLE